MGAVWRVAGLGVHLLLVASSVVAVVVVASRHAYLPLRVALIVLVVVLCAVTLAGRLPFGLGPVGGSVAARVVRMAGVVLAGLGATGVVLGLAQGGSPAERAFGGIPVYTVVLAVHLAAFLAATGRDGELPPRALLTGVGLGLLAGALFAVAVPVLPPGLIWLAYLLVAGATAGAVRLNGPAAGLLAVVAACQVLFFAAAVLYRYGPDAWMPYAGPGPLTVQAQVEQNRAEAIDPYVGLLVLGAVAASVLAGRAVAARLRVRGMWRRHKAERMMPDTSLPI